jgi:hypothetical protein
MHWRHHVGTDKKDRNYHLEHVSYIVVDSNNHICCLTHFRFYVGKNLKEKMCIQTIYELDHRFQYINIK